MIVFARWFGSLSFLRKFARWLFIGKRDERLIQKHYGIEFLSPIGLAAGLDKNAEIIPAISSIGFGFETIGSVTARRCDGNPRPWFYRLPKTQSLVINVGFANHGVEAVIGRIKKNTSRVIGKFPIVLSVAQTNGRDVTDEKSGIDDYVTSIKLAKDEKKIKMIELNISCPNNFGGESFMVPDRLYNLLKAVDAIKVKKPVFVKFPSDLSWKEARLLLDVIVKHNIAGVNISNLATNRTKTELHDKLPDRISGSISGKPIRWLSNDLIRLTYKNYGDKLMIIGGGGVLSAKDAYVKIRFGASLIELVTGVILNGPQLAAEINDELLDLLEKDGYKHVSQAIGVDVLDYMKE
jgi:dihydroorotate dehydrogenase (fumarate)